MSEEEKENNLEENNQPEANSTGEEAKQELNSTGQAGGSETPLPEAMSETPSAETPETEDDLITDLTGIEEESYQEIVQKVTKKERKKRKRDRSQDKAKEAPEWIEKVIQIRRVTKVVKGGKKLSFRAVVVVGNGKNQVGVGVGKAAEVISAIQKGVSDAKKNLVTVQLIQATIPHQVIGREVAAKVLLKPAREGTGIKAGGAARTVLELGGVGDILSKSLGSRNPLNVARATVDGLSRVRTFKEIAGNREISLKDMLNEPKSKKEKAQV